MKKLIVVGIIILLVGMSIPSTGINIDKVSTSSFGGNTLYVGGDGPGNYTRIQDAINASSDGDIVFVYNGTYYERLEINKSLELIGEDRNSTIIDGMNIFIHGWNPLISKNVTICGFTIIAILELQGHGNITITNNNILGYDFRFDLYDQNGLNICSGIGNYIISNNTISGWNDSGMYWWTPSSWMKFTIINNVFSDNKYDGIYIEKDGHIVIGNIFINNYIGLNMADSNECNISGNTFKGNTCGMNLGNCNHNKIYQNNFIKNIRMVRFYLGSYYNNWDSNYWGRPRVLPKAIIGSIGLFIPSWFNIDRTPAKEPYDI